MESKIKQGTTEKVQVLRFQGAAAAKAEATAWANEQAEQAVLNAGMKDQGIHDGKAVQVRPAQTAWPETANA